MCIQKLREGQIKFSCKGRDATFKASAVTPFSFRVIVWVACLHILFISNDVCPSVLFAQKPKALHGTADGIPQVLYAHDLDLGIRGFYLLGETLLYRRSVDSLH